MDGSVAIDNVKAPGGGRIGLVHCPGTGMYGMVPEHRQGMLDLDLATLRQWGARALVTLLQPAEMEMLGVGQLGERVRGNDMVWWHLPIVDGGAPGRAFEEAWPEAGQSLHGVLDDGGRVVLHCRAGIGRTGTVAARLLIERGLAPEEAVVAIRRARPGAIESLEQMSWVRLQRPR